MKHLKRVLIKQETFGFDPMINDSESVNESILKCLTSEGNSKQAYMYRYQAH